MRLQQTFYAFAASGCPGLEWLGRRAGFIPAAAGDPGLPDDATAWAFPAASGAAPAPAGRGLSAAAAAAAAEAAAMAAGGGLPAWTNVSG
jgi:hypothetical protein